MSFFTNVPLSKTIELMIDCIYSEDNLNAASFSRDVFKKLMFMATQGFFMFNDCLYQQIDEVTMGSALGPTIASFFLGQLKEKILGQNLSASPKLYLRYVDDVYAVFDDHNSSSSFLSSPNAKHRDIKFTIEKAIKTLSFLDVERNIKNNGFESWVWRKKQTQE